MIKRILFKIFRKLSEEFSSMKNSLKEYEEESKLINNLISAYEAAANRRMRRRVNRMIFKTNSPFYIGDKQMKKVVLSTLYDRLGLEEEGRINGTN